MSLEDVITSTNDRVVRVEPTAPNRRRAFRVTAVTVPYRAWRMDVGERLFDRPLPSKRLQVTGIDMCPGGVGLLVPGQVFDDASTTLRAGDRLRIEMPAAGEEDDPIVVEGQVTSVVQSSNLAALRVGVEFKPSGSPQFARRDADALAKLLAKLQRADIRAARDARDAHDEARDDTRDAA
jgi:hypothetical protein